MHVRLFLSAALVICASCVSPDDDTAPAPTDDDTDAPTSGVVRVETPDGPQDIHYVVEDGLAVYEGDVILGTVAEMHQRGGAFKLGARWPNGIIFYTFDPLFCTIPYVPSTCPAVQDPVRQALAGLDAATVLDLVEIPWADRAAYPGYVRFAWGSTTASAGQSDSIGFRGGEQNIFIRGGSVPSAGSSTVPHEMLHAAGMWHEHSRWDRNQFVDYHAGCVAPGQEGNFDTEIASANVGPYDFASLMHYRSTSGCWKPDGTNCICWPLTKKGATGSAAQLTAGMNFLTDEDVNSVLRAYTTAPGVNEAADAFGAAVATGDFDRDGYTDVAVGVPTEDYGATNNGVVMLWKGTSAGLVAWGRLDEADFAGETRANGEQFGASLAAGDFDGDNRIDLAVGAPFEDVGGVVDAGAVYIYRGTANGLVASRVMTESNTGAETNETSDQFGGALAAGRITRSTVLGNVVDELVVGAPGEIEPVLLAGNRRTGAVFVFHRPGSGTRATELWNGGTDARFGAAIAVGDLDGDGLGDLAVGAPDAVSGKGRTFLYSGRNPPENPLAWSAMATYRAMVQPPSAAAGDAAGTAVATGNLIGAAGDSRELAVGAPGRGGHGEVQVYTVTSAWTVELARTLVDSDPATGDDFGAALAVGRPRVSRAVAAMDDLVVGVPGEDSDAGKIVVFRPGSTAAAVSIAAERQQTSISSSYDHAAGDRFGAALALGDVNGAGAIPSTDDFADDTRWFDDLVVGAPGEDTDDTIGRITIPNAIPDAGSIYVLYGATTMTGGQMRHQELTGRL